MIITSGGGWILKTFLAFVPIFLLAATGCSKIISLNRSTPLKQAEKYFENGQYIKAAPLYEQELQSKPRERDRDRILLRLALSYLLIEGPRHRPDRARELLEALLREFPKSEWKPYAQVVLSTHNHLERSMQRKEAQWREAVAEYESKLKTLANDNENLSENVELLRQEREELEHALQLRQQALEAHIDRLEKESLQNAALRAEADRLKEELEELKKIDLGRSPSP